MILESNLEFILSITPILLYSTLCGTIVGFERARRGCAAGMKTQVFIGVGSSLFTMAAMAINKDGQGETGRMIAQIASGVGFIGAGTIMAKDKIIGLTTAAIVWVMAGLGILSALGFGPACVVISLGMVVAVETLSFIERKFAHVLHKEELIAKRENLSVNSFFNRG
jgi:uncharacterized membrane protein YhiD involved in acid resistance